MTSSADLVVRGYIRDLYVGEYWQMEETPEPLPLTYFSIEISEVLKGEPVSRTAGFVEVQVAVADEDLDEYRAQLPSHEHLWFLMYELDHRDRVPPNDSEIAPFVYGAPNDYQGVLRNIDGLVRVLGKQAIAEADGAERYPLPLEGTDFESVVEQVRAVAHGMREGTLATQLASAARIHPATTP